MKNIGLIIIGIAAIVGGALFATYLIKKKLDRENELEFDDFDDFEDLTEEEYEDFFGEEMDIEDASEIAENISAKKSMPVSEEYITDVVVEEDPDEEQL